MNFNYVNTSETKNRFGEVEVTKSLNVPKILGHVASAIAILIGGVVLWPLHQVPTGHRGVITVGGAIRGIENEGYVLLAPWQKLTIFNVRAEEAQIDNAEGSTSDVQPVKVSMTVRYAIFPDKVASVFENYSRDGNLDSYVATATQEVFKAVTAKYTAPELISKRAEVSQGISSSLAAKLKPYGASVINIDMRNFAFSDSYMKAINDKVTQQQAAQAAEARLHTVEAEQKQKVAVAEAEASATRATADGEAYRKLTTAKAEAEALAMLNRAVAQNKDVLELKRIEVQLVEANRWDGVRVPNQFYGSAPVEVRSIAAK